MTTNGGVAKLDAILRAMERIKGTWLLSVVPASTDDATKLRFLAASGRPFLQSTPELQRAITTAVATRVADALRTSPDALDPMVVYQAAAAAARDHVVARFERGGVDVRLAPLAPAYRLWKLRHGRDMRVGINTRALLNDLKSAARFLVRRVG